MHQGNLARYDTNKDGYLDAGELQKLMEEVMVWDGDSGDHPTEDEAARFISSMDEDGNSLLDQEEFVQFIRQCLAMDTICASPLPPVAPCMQN